ncbi:MAG: DNA mismatch repair protein MutS [Bacillota bacterium]|nr:DNA mismatch repair protein MutS [Bacillota bacterium]
MLKQYYELKRECGDALVLFRLGDFFELFGEDARVAARILEITLTGRDAGRAGRIPMCGVPYHAVQGYAAKLVAAGYKVALCDQIEDPKLAKGIVRRAVVRIITPGTAFDLDNGDGRGNRYLAAVVTRAGAWGLAYADVSTGEFATTELRGDRAESRLRDELRRLNPAELLVPESGATDDHPAVLQREYARLVRPGEPGPAVTPLEEATFSPEAAGRVLRQHFGTVSLAGFGCEGLPLAIGASGALLAYLQRTQRAALTHLTRLVTYSVEESMTLDPATRRSLELCEAQRDGSRKGTLLWVLDHTVTAMGGRLLRDWLQRPLKGVEPINRRLEAVEDLVRDGTRRRLLRQALQKVYDLERLLGRVGLGVANGRDLVALGRSLAEVPAVKDLCLAAGSALLREVGEQLDPLTDLAGLLQRALVDDPPVGIKEGGLIRPGYCAELDQLREAATSGKDWIAGLEAKEREATGIKSLKVGFNKVFGYYIEVTRPNLPLVPAGRYERKQTLVNAERFVTPELKEYEALVLGAEEKMAGLEYDLFVEVRDAVAERAAQLQATARLLATVDVLASLAEAAVAGGYCRPTVSEGEALRIVEGRHPVVERTLPSGAFVPNDTNLDADHRFLLVTGPNMAGKSTYLRQVALIVLMAQIGSFVPAKAAEIGLVDRIFTRVGAADDLAGGQSTFMVEMTEVANILHHATRRSLIILDEVGRGTSTFDGLAIAWAVTEYIHDPGRLGAKTLFATHYHELTRLEGRLPGLRNVSVAVRREGENVVFLHRIIPGGADESYGIEVAKLAGLPRPLLRRAREVLDRLEWETGPALGQGTAAPVGRPRPGRGRRRERSVVPPVQPQLSLFGEASHDLLRRLGELDVTTTTPLDALNLLAELVAEARRALGEPAAATATQGTPAGHAVAGKAE